MSLWTADDVLYRILEAAQTQMRLPGVNPPGWKGTALWGEYRDGYAHPKHTKVKPQRPDGAALDRMEEVWSWINTWLTEDERHLIYSWSWTKTRKGHKLWKLARKLNLSDRGLFDAKRSICAKIADKLNKSRFPHLTATENTTKMRANQITSQNSVKRADHWMAEGAKPRVTKEVREARKAS